MPSITQLRYLVSIHKTKHFGRAAKECHVSQPSLSAQIQKLEEQLGFIIFDRSKSPVLTTVKGQQVIAQAKIVLAEHKKLEGFANEPGEVAGPFHLGVIPTLSPYVVPRFIESFANQHPLVELTISELQTSQIIEALYEDKLDGGLLVTPLNNEKLKERVLFHEPFYLFTYNDQLLKKGHVKEGDLDPGLAWLLDEGHCLRNQTLRICSRRTRQKVLPNITFASGSLDTLINMTRRSTGYTLLPYLASEQLSPLERANNIRPFSKPVPSREVSLVHRRTYLKEKILEALEKNITDNTPKELKSLKPQTIDIIDI